MKPMKGDYNSYYQVYIDKVPDGDILKILSKQKTEIQKFLNSIPEEKGDYSYAEGKWNIKEVIVHITDVERVFAYRILTFSRGEKQSLPGFDQDEYVKNSNVSNRTLSDIVYEYRMLRESNYIFFSGLDKNVYNMKGIANGSEISVNALLYIIAGHVIHHIEVLKERYLKL